MKVYLPNIITDIIKAQKKIKAYISIRSASHCLNFLFHFRNLCFDTKKHVKSRRGLEVFRNRISSFCKKEDVKVMCNLSDGIEERGIIKGKAEGRTELLKQLVQKKLAKGQSVEVIAEELVEDVKVIRRIVDEMHIEE